MKKIFILLILAIGAFFNLNAQLALSTFNSSGMGGWQMINDNNTLGAPWTATYQTKWRNAAFVKIPIATGDSALIAPAVFVPAASPDRWLISPSFTVENSDNSFLLFDYLGNDGATTKSEEFEILVSPTASITKLSFVSVINLSAGSNGKVIAANIGAYKGQTVRVAIKYKSTNGFLCYIDNIRTRVLPNTDISLASISPSLNSIAAYGAVGSTVQISGVVANIGAKSVSDYTINYQAGTSPIVSQTISPFFFNSYDVDAFTFTVPYTIAAQGVKDIKVWVTATGDTTRSNDTLKTKVTGVAFMPKKKILFEQATGTWCQWCPRGHVFMDSFAEKPQNGTTIAVHNGDPMAITAYDNGIQGVQGFTGFPGMSVDRVSVVDPSEMFDEYQARKNYFGFADMKRTVPTITGNTLSTKVTVRPAADLSGIYRLVLVVSESKINNPAYSQKNAYSNNIDLIYKGVNWKNLPSTVPGTDMEYNHVARAIYPSFSGDATSALPSTMKANEDYTVDLSGAYSQSWNQANLHYSIILINGTNGQALNSINDTGYLAPKSSGSGSDTFHAKVFKVTTAATTTADVYSSSLTLPLGTNYTWTVKKSNIFLPNGAGWKLATICDPRNCYIYKDDLTDTFNARSSNNKIYLTFDHNKTVGYGYAILDLWKTSEGESKKVSYKYSLLTSNASSITLVSDASDKLLHYFDNKIFVDVEFNGAQLEVYDLKGQLILNTKVVSDNIDFTPLTSGIYIARISKDGQVLKSHKFTTSK